MKMNQSAALLVAIILTAVVCGLSFGNDRSYRVEPRISLPEYRTDAGRAIDAYERMMLRYMDITERDLNFIALQMRQMSRQMEQLDRKLDNISTRLERIEKHMGITEAGQQNPSDR